MLPTVSDNFPKAPEANQRHPRTSKEISDHHEIEKRTHTWGKDLIVTHRLSANSPEFFHCAAPCCLENRSSRNDPNDRDGTRRKNSSLAGASTTERRHWDEVRSSRSARPNAPRALFLARIPDIPPPNTQSSRRHLLHRTHHPRNPADGTRSSEETHDIGRCYEGPGSFWVSLVFLECVLGLVDFGTVRCGREWTIGVGCVHVI
jgi:hypothetical protein